MCPMWLESKSPTTTLAFPECVPEAVVNISVNKPPVAAWGWNVRCECFAGSILFVKLE